MTNRQIDIAQEVLTGATSRGVPGLGEVVFALDGLRPKGITETEPGGEQAAPKSTSPKQSHRERFMTVCSAITPALTELYDQVEKVKKELATAKTFLSSAWQILNRHTPPAGTKSNNPVLDELAVLCTQISKSGLQPN